MAESGASSERDAIGGASHRKGSAQRTGSGATRRTNRSASRLRIVGWHLSSTEFGWPPDFSDARRLHSACGIAIAGMRKRGLVTSDKARPSATHLPATAKPKALEVCDTSGVLIGGWVRQRPGEGGASGFPFPAFGWVFRLLPLQAPRMGPHHRSGSPRTMGPGLPE